MTYKLEQAARQIIVDWDSGIHLYEAITALREALAEQAVEPEQEPVHESLQIAAVALQDIACSSQTNNLLWWQIRAREAQKQIAERLTNSAPAEPVKQEPVAWAHPSGGYLSARYMKEFATGLEKETYTIPLYAAPFRTKDLTPQDINKICDDVFAVESSLHDFARAVIAADREKNK